MANIRVTDDLGHTFELKEPPRRIVSLVPSDTYSLVALGAKDRLVGRTRYCVAPAEDVKDIEIVGGTKDVDVQKVADLKPDLVVANQEEGSKHDLDRMTAMGLRVLVSFPKRVAAGVAHLARLAVALGAKKGDEPARTVLADAYAALRAAEEAKGERRVKTFIPIWMDPLMTCNAQTFMSDMLELCGGENAFAERDRKYPLAADIGTGKQLPPEKVGDRDTRYPRVTLDEIVAAQPELVLLPDEPHAFSEADAAVFRGLDIPASKNQKVLFCDGKDLMWYGARSLLGIGCLRALIASARV